MQPPATEPPISLRLIASNDAGWVWDACADGTMRRWIPHLPFPYTEADAVAHIGYANGLWETGRGGVFVIEDDDTVPLGLIEINRDPNDQAVASIGYWLRPQARGQGAATHAVRAVSQWAFDDLGVRRINLTTDPENTPSQRVAVRAGYTREGLLRAWQPTPNGRRDSVMFSFVR